MVEHRTPNPGVGGSNPSWPAIICQQYQLKITHPSEIMTAKKKSRSIKAKSVGKKDIATSGKKASFSPSAIRAFIQEVQVEFNKIAWPQKKVTVGLTGFVIVLVVIISLYLGMVDLLLGKFVSTLLN